MKILDSVCKDNTLNKKKIKKEYYSQKQRNEQYC